MRYLMLLWGDPEGEAALSPDERRTIVDAHVALGARLRDERKLVLAEALAGGGGKVVRGGLVTDGPFAETKEHLGSVYVVDVASEAEALELARAIPQSPGLVVELVATA